MVAHVLLYCSTVLAIGCDRCLMALAGGKGALHAALHESPGMHLHLCAGCGMCCPHSQVDRMTHGHTVCEEQLSAAERLPALYL